MGRMRSFAEVARDLVSFYRETRKLAFLIVALVLLAMGALIVFAEKSVLMPLIYTLF